MNEINILSKEDFYEFEHHFSWEKSLKSIFNSCSKGSGAKIAILDTGIDYSHDDLKPAVKGGINFSTEYRSDYLDRHGHGTFCAGIISGSDNNEGITGVAPDAELYAVKVVNDQGLGTPDWVTRGIEWCIDHSIDVVNLSFEDCKPYPPMELALKRGVNAGMIFVGSAGNTGDGDAKTNETLYPSAYPEVISVSAHDQLLSQANFCSTNPEVDICAPGVNIISCFPGNRFAVMSGTSMAAPFVTGVFALIKSMKRGVDLLTIENYLKRISVDKSIEGKDPIYGWGILDIDQVHELLKNMESKE